MDCQISTYIEEGRLHLISPYNPALVAEAREAGRVWDRDKKTWSWRVDRGEEFVKAKFGLSAELARVRVPPAHWVESYYDGALILGGYLLAYRRGRDTHPQLFADLVKGTLPSSGGSAKHPAVSPSEDAEFEIVVRADFAAAHGLEVVEEAEAPQPPVGDPARPLRNLKSATLSPENLLASVSDQDLLAECRSRGLAPGETQGPLSEEAANGSS